MSHGHSDNRRKLSVMEAYVMAVGGMIGGGIFSVLGLVVEIAGHLAPLSFLLAGVLTCITGLSYAGLYEKHRVAGGSVAFVRIHTGSEDAAGHIGWALVLGYVFTNSLYAFTFGHYLSHVFNAPEWVPNIAALGITLFLLVVNLLGVGESALTAVITVWGKLAILGGLAAFGLWHFDVDRITPLANHGFVSPVMAAAVIFIAFEGFQLLAYDVDDMEDAERNLRRAMLPSIITTTLVYFFVAIAGLMLVSEANLIQEKEVALAIAGQNILGRVGLWIVTVGALFSTTSAINATLFGTSRLALLLAYEKQMPSWMKAVSARGVPHVALTVIAIAGGLFAMLGSIERIVTFASLMFLAVFAIVNFIYAREAERLVTRIAAGVASGGLFMALLTVLVWLFTNRREALYVAIVVAIALICARIWFLRKPVYDR